MHGIFIAAGPSFRQGVTVPAFENIEVYDVQAAALRVAPAPNDGSGAIARRIMR
jgi:hypothetical protein